MGGHSRGEGHHSSQEGTRSLSVVRLQDVEKALDEVLKERKEKVNPYEGRDLDELDDDMDVCPEPNR